MAPAMPPVSDRVRLEPKPAPLAGAGRASECRSLIGALEQAARLRQERLTRGGESGTPAVALEELNAQLRLERADLLTDAWLRQMEAIGCSAEVELLGDGDEG